MSKAKEVARRDGQTAGKTAGIKRWRTVRKRDGGYVLQSPDGREYRGTAAEIREAALLPWQRSMLADGLRVQWLTTKPQTEERAWLAAARRREAIEHAAAPWAQTGRVEIPSAIFIKLVAGSRLVSGSFDDYLRELWESEINGLLDAAEEETGKREFPLTRHERAALDRIEAKDVQGKECAA